MSLIKDNITQYINTSVLNDIDKSDVFVDTITKIERLYTVIPTLPLNIIEEITRSIVSVLSQTMNVMKQEQQALLKNRLSFVLGCVSETEFMMLKELLLIMGSDRNDVNSIMSFISGKNNIGPSSSQKIEYLGGVRTRGNPGIETNPDTQIVPETFPNPNAQNMPNRTAAPDSSSNFAAMIELGFTPNDIIGIMTQMNRQAELQNESRVIDQSNIERRNSVAAMIVGLFGNMGATYLFHTHLRTSASAAIVSSISRIIGYVGSTAGMLETGGTRALNMILSYVSSSSLINTNGTTFTQGLFNLLAADLADAGESAIEICVLLISILFMFVLGYSFTIMYALIMGRGLNFKIGLTGLEFGANNKKGGKSKKIRKRGRKRKQTRKHLK